MRVKFFGAVISKRGATKADGWAGMVTVPVLETAESDDMCADAVETIRRAARDIGVYLYERAHVVIGFEQILWKCRPEWEDDERPSMGRLTPGP